MRVVHSIVSEVSPVACVLYVELVHLTTTPGFYAPYNSISVNIVNALGKMTTYRHEKTQTQYAVFNEGGGLVSYDDARAICDKVQYAIQRGLRGGKFLCSVQFTRYCYLFIAAVSYVLQHFTFQLFTLIPTIWC